MIKKFQYSFNELNITSSDLEELLGFETETIPEPFPELIELGLNEARKFCNPTGGFKIFESIDLNTQKGTLKINGQQFLPAKIVSIQLKKATGAALFVCTAGHEITTRSKQIAENGDQLLSYVFDVIGSVAVDKATDNMQEDLKKLVNENGLNISDRFSPGYCEWNVSDQQKLFALLPPGFCGIKLAESSLMNPIKSVSGIIGIGPDLKQKGYQCYWCNDSNCIYGKRNRKKINKKNG